MEQRDLGFTLDELHLIIDAKDDHLKELEKDQAVVTEQRLEG